MATIVVIDDEPTSQLVVQATLESRRHLVVLVDDPREAVRQAMPAGKAPDAIVLDLFMPGISGWELLDAFRANRITRDTPILMLSAATDTATRVRALRQGADDFLIKPFEPEELLARIEGLISRNEATYVGLAGNLETSPLIELLQNLESGQKTGELWIENNDVTARVSLVEGQIYAAELGHLQGAEAILAMTELEQGRFRFDLVENGRPAQNGLPLRPLILEAVWLQDELARYFDDMPDPQQQLVLRKLPPPGALDELPFEPFRRALIEAPKSTVDQLIKRLPVSPGKVRLIAARLNHLRLFEPSNPEEVDELFDTRKSVSSERSAELDASLRDLFQLALFKGCNLSAVNLEIFVHPFAWSYALEWLRELPSAELDERQRQYLAEKGGEVRLAHGEGTLILHFEALSARTQPKPKADRLGVVLLIKSIFPAPLFKSLLERFEQLAGAETELVLIGADPASRDYATAQAASRPRWRQLEALPAGLSELLEAIS
jgi:DNA-binding response OmpR family regulator